jgi:hypothetical protein
MDQMSAFEQQLARIAAEMAGPLRPVDAMAIVRSAQARPVGRWSVRLRRFVGGAATPTERGFTMSSALKLVAAGVIVALFGGFLLAGVLRTPQDGEVLPAAVSESPAPMTTEEFLATMHTEEVEPGVVEVLEDGHRDLMHGAGGEPWGCERVIVGGSDQVWRTDDCWRLFRLGQPDGWDYDQEVMDLGWGRSFASLDGRLWALEAASQSPSAPYVLRLFYDGDWVPDPRLDEPGHGQIHVEDDGTVWLVGIDGVIHWAGDTSVGTSSWRDAWTGKGDRDGVTLLSVTDDGVVWLMTEAAEDGSVSFLRFDGTDWRVVPGPEGFRANPLGGTGLLSAGVSGDGTLWMAGDSLVPHVSLARLDGDGWTTFTDADGVEPWGGQAAWWGTTMDTLWAAPDGSVWVNASIATIRADEGPGCDGLARFDGERWQPFFSGSCISDLDFAPDGSVWVVVQEGQGWENRTVHTYVITPEAVAAKEAETFEPPSFEEATVAEEAPTATEDLMPGMITEEVEPGVFQVTSDGVRDIASVEAVDIVAGYDGGIWLLQKDEFLRLGTGETHRWPDLRAGGRVFEVAPDGTMWVIAADGPKWVIAGRGYVEYPEARGRGYYSTDGEEWTVQPCPDSDGATGGGTSDPLLGCQGVSVAPDGTVWASWRDGPGQWRVGHLGPAGWQPLDGYTRVSHGGAAYYERLFFTDAGDVYGVDYYMGDVFRYEDGDWQRISGAGLVDVGWDGTVWQADGPGDDLARFADGEWTRWNSAAVPDIRLGLDYGFEVALDGSLWFSLWQSADGEPPGGDPPEGDWYDAVRDGHLVCDGLARFDGEAVDRFLAGRCVSMDIAADGSVWVLSDADLYVITPEAVAATG